MKYYKLKYDDDTFEIVKSSSIKDLIKKYDLATKEHINTRIIELAGEQLLIAIDNKK